jgi:hypothetical protein
VFKRCSAHLLLQNAELIQHFDFWNATDGTEDRHQGKVSRCANLQAHRPDSLDTVTIDRRRPTVMFVDDTGMIDGKPVNPKATALYTAFCRPGTVHQVHGDAVIVPAGGLA